MVESYNLGKLNVLVVEGHQLMRRVMRDVMTALGVKNIEVITVDQLNNPQYANFQPDVIFADWSPNCDGVDVIKQIREKKRDFDRYIPIVMVSAFTELTQVCMARDAGVTEFLAKPISATTIYRRICSMVENPRDFIETSSFFGPNRRRRSIGSVGDERRKEMTHLAGGRGDQRQAFPEKDK